MKSGQWIPLAKGFARHLPTDRPYTELEAAFSLQLDYDQDREVSVAGLAKCWGWSRKKVSYFLERIGVAIFYPGDTSKIQNQRGQIGIQIGGRSGADRGQMRFIDNKDLAGNGNRKGADEGQKGGRSGSTTKDTNTKTKEKHTASGSPDAGGKGVFYLTKRKKKLAGKRLETFEMFWEAFDFKHGKAEAADAWLDIPELTNTLVEKIIVAARREAKDRPGLMAANGKPKWAQGWISGRRWEDEPGPKIPQQREGDGQSRCSQCGRTNWRTLDSYGVCNYCRNAMKDNPAAKLLQGALQDFPSGVDEGARKKELRGQAKGLRE